MKNLGNMLKQAQAMQAKMTEMQELLASTEIEGAAAGGLVRIVLTGKGDMRRVAIDPKAIGAGAVDGADVTMLEDLILAAYNDAKAKVDAFAAAEMQKVTGGLSLPPGMKLPF
jgi:DNA-binding YbaB/EbfC family protein